MDLKNESERNMGTLETLKEDLNKKRFMDLATNIVKYQKFRTNCAMQKFKADFSDTTTSNYFGLGITYIKTGERAKNIPSSLYNCLDEVLEKHVQPLTPSIEEERVIKTKNYKKKNAVPPIAKLEVINKPLTANVEYGVKSGNIITLMPNREYARGFLAGLKNLNPNREIDAKVVTVEVGDINE